jgi:hypothetical protein
VAIENDQVLLQTGGYLGVDDDQLSFTALGKAGSIRAVSSSFTAVAIVTPAVRRDVTWRTSGFPGNPAKAVVPRVPIR